MLAAVALLGVLAEPADAHSLLQTAIPGDGAALEAAPLEVRLTFNEPISASIGALRVYDETGEQIDAGDASTADGDPRTVRVRLRDGLGGGTYVATFAVTSADAHPVRGAILYSVGEAAGDDDAELAAIFARALADPAVVGRVLATSFGRSAGVRLAGLALLHATLPGVWSRPGCS